jgi:hypothetical protein
MPRDYTATKRAELLRKEHEAHGDPYTKPTQDPAAGDWTGQIHRARRVLEDPEATDEQREAASEWLRVHTGTYQGPLSWGG